MSFKKRTAPPNLRKRSIGDNVDSPEHPSKVGEAIPNEETALLAPQPKMSRKGIDANEILGPRREKAGKTKEAQEEEEKGDIFSLDAEGRLVSEDTQRVFTQLEIDTDKSHDHRAIWERNFAIGEKLRTGELESGVYRGQGAYVSHMKQREDAIRGNKYTGLHGPLRGSQFARTTLRIDYNPEICKDYKETGYCGFGDTCKFLHDRSDYKAGWQIDKEWEQEQRRKQELLLQDKLDAEKRLLKRRD